MGKVDIHEEGDNQYTHGDMNYAPIYTYYSWNQNPGQGQGQGQGQAWDAPPANPPPVV